ncbi:retrovirus-related pol polyprotein from transposon TNT 1-94 [Tanacetum coccineum]
MTKSPFVYSGLAVPVFSPGEDPIACLNKAMAFLTDVASSRFPSTNNQLRTSSNTRNHATIQDNMVTVQQVQGRQGQNYSGTTYKGNATSLRGNTTSRQARVVKCYNCQGEGHMARQCTQPNRPRNATWYKEKAMLVEAQEARQILDEEQLAFLTDPRIPAGQAQTINPHNAAFQTEDLDTYDSDCDDLSTAQAVLMANVSNYGSDVILEANVQDTNLQAQQNNESITAELERYKERVKTFEQRLNIDLSSREKMIDSQMDDMIREKLALKEQIDSLEQNLSKQIKEKESLFKTFYVFKRMIQTGQYAQTVHMLTKPQAFYDNTHKQALGYQNPFYLKKAQRIKPTLNDGAVMSNTHVVMPVIDDEETLFLEEESRSKMSKKAKVSEVIAKKISYKPIDYEKLNRLTEDFGKCFSPQQELSAEQAFWFHILNPTIKPSYTPPVIMDVPSELPKSTVNCDESCHLNNDSVNMEMQKCEMCEKCLNLDADLSKSKQAYNDLLKNYSQLEKHCILSSRRIYAIKTRSISKMMNLAVIKMLLEIQEYFEINDLKARLQDKDKTICKLKDTIRSLKKNTKEENVIHDKRELEPKMRIGK